MRSNCVIWAVTQYVRRGGYLVARRSRYGWWWHLLWSPDLQRFYAFVPNRRHRKRWVPPLYFQGYVRGAKEDL
jgi:hypothetical protein